MENLKSRSNQSGVPRKTEMVELKEVEYTISQNNEEYYDKSYVVFLNLDDLEDNEEAEQQLFDKLSEVNKIIK